jgi:hypothetical protein
MISILHPVRMRATLNSAEKLTDWKLFQSLFSQLISPNIQIHSSNEVDKTAYGFAVSRASACSILSRKTTILDWKYEIPGLDLLLKYTRSSMQNDSKLGHLKYHENGPDRALKRWETKLANCKFKPQAIWPIVEFLSKRG